MQTELSRKQVIIRASLIAVLAALPFLPTLVAGFPWDELRALQGASLFIMPAEHYYARPLAVMVLGWEHALMGEWSTGYHLFSIVLHMSNAVLFYHLARRIIPAEAPALLSAALFAMYPVHAETLGLVMGQAVLLGSLFAISSFLLYLVYVRKGVREALVAGALFALVGSLAWQAVLIVPLIVVAHSLSVRMERTALLNALLSYAAAIIVYLLFFGGLGEIFHESGLGADKIGRFLFAMGYHVAKLLTPVFVSFASPFSEDAALILPVVGVLAGLVLMWVEGMRREALIALSMLLLLVPAALAVSYEMYLMAWLRHCYLGAAGSALLVGALLGRFQGKILFKVTGAVLLTVFAVSSVYASMPWRSREMLWRGVVIDNQYSALPMLNLAAAAITEGRSDAGRDYLARAVTFRTLNREDMLNTMKLYAALGGANDEPGLLAALTAQRGKSDALMGLGAMHMELYHKKNGSGAVADGKAHLGKALEYFGLAAGENPGEPLYHFHLGVALIESGDLAGGESAISKAFALETDEGRREDVIKILGLLSALSNKPESLTGPGPQNSPAAPR